MFFWILFACQEKDVDTAQPSAEPASQPGTEPESQPSAEPESQPTSEPESQPTSEPTNEPESQPTDEPISEGQAEFSFAEAVETPTHLFMDAVDLDGDTYVDIILKETTGGYSWSKGDGRREVNFRDHVLESPLVLHLVQPLVRKYCTVGKKTFLGFITRRLILFDGPLPTR